MLRRLGAHVIDADRLVHGLLAQGQPVYHQVVATFGAGILSATGDIDRRRLGRIVFGDPVALRRLEEITHPAVDALVQQEIAAATAAVVVVDAIKLIESGLSRRCNAVWVVTAPAEQQLARLVEKRGLSREDALQRISAQAPQQDKMRLADVVIDNSGAEAQTEAQVAAAWRRIGQRRARRQERRHDQQA
jgi:dephospho-CoA kinase